MKLSQPNAIKIAAVITAAPRWMIALLAAEGFALPENWKPGWIIASTVLSGGMAIVEGLAFSYMLTAWRNQKDAKADRLLWMAIASAMVFILVMTPSIGAQVRGVTVNEILSIDWVLYLWAALVGLSTIVIVGGVGYAEKSTEVNESEQLTRAREQVKATKEEAKKAIETANKERTESERKLTEALTLANEKIRDNEQTMLLMAERHQDNLIARDEKLRESESRRIEAENKFNEYSGLLAEDKKTRVLTVRTLWPDLAYSGIEAITGAKAGYISEVLNNHKAAAVNGSGASERKGE